MFFLMFLIARSFARMLAGRRSNSGSKDLEILVLRHQLKVLRRKVGRPKLRPWDRVLLAAASRVLPRNQWASFMVTPQTLLRCIGNWYGRSGPTAQGASRDDLRSTPRFVG